MRLLGWRYSATREAYVHRVGKGRRGPVFTPLAADRETAEAGDDHLTVAVRAALAAPRALAQIGPPIAAMAVAPTGAPSTPGVVASAATAPQPPTTTRAPAPPVGPSIDLTDGEAPPPPPATRSVEPAPTPPLARRRPRPPARRSGTTTRRVPVEVRLDGEVRTVTVDGSPPVAPDRRRLAIAPGEARADDAPTGRSEASA